MKLNRLILAFFLTVSFAVAQEDLDVRFNYFGNVQASKLSNSKYTLNNYNHDNVDNDTSFSPYSKIGGQVSLLYDDYTFTAQGLARRNHSEYDAELTWFNAKYDFNENISMKIGRIQTTTLLNSDSIDIDYVHLWSKPPDDVYRILGISTFDGIELSYKNYFDEYDYNIVFTPYAQAEKDLNDSADTQTKAIIDNAMNLKFNLENGPYTFQGSYTKSDVDLPYADAQLIGLQKALSGAPFYNDMSRFSYVDKVIKVWTVGLKYDDGDFIFNSEYARMDTTSLLPSMTTYFALVGYRYNKYTPFFMYARNKADKAHFDTSNISGPDELKKALDDVLYSTDTSQKTLSVGLRYDVKPGIAVTAQVDKMSTSSNGVEGSINKRGILEYELGAERKPVYMYTIGVSFAF